MCCYFSLSSRGDQILEVNSVNVRHAALSKVHSILSKCPPGPVRLVIGRHPNPKVRYLTLFWVWDDGLAAGLANDSIHTSASLLQWESSPCWGCGAGCQPVTDAHGKWILNLDFIFTVENFIGKCCRGYLVNLKSDLMESRILSNPHSCLAAIKIFNTYIKKTWRYQARSSL